MSEFKCPQCGGPYFGTCNIFKSDDTIECHCDVNGGSLSIFNPDGTFRQAKEIGKPCGWRGTREEAFQRAVS